VLAVAGLVPRRPPRTAAADAVALLVFVAIGVATHGASATAFVRDLLCFELAWLAVARATRGRFLPTWLPAVTIAVAVRAAFVGHFAADFYGVALGFTALLVLPTRALLRHRG
jgi:hypothetical protein